MDKTRHEIRPGVWLDARRAVWFEEGDVLAVADLHLGYAWAQREAGQLIPVTGRTTHERLRELVAAYRPRSIVLLGDIIHGSAAGDQLAEELRELVEVLSSSFIIHWLVGNHDGSLGRHLSKAGLPAELKTSWRVRPHLLLHGDNEEEASRCLEEAGRTGGSVFMGHEHPAVSVGDGLATRVKVPCFLWSEHVVVLPAFSDWAAGIALGSRPFMTPIARAAGFSHAGAIIGRKLVPIRLPT